MKFSILKEMDVSVFYLMTAIANKAIIVVFVKMSSRINTHLKKQLKYQYDQKNYFTK